MDETDGILVRLHQGIYLFDDDLWQCKVQAERLIHMPCAPAIGWEIQIGHSIAPREVESICYSVQAGELHVQLKPIQVESKAALTTATASLSERGFKTQDFN